MSVLTFFKSFAAPSQVSAQTTRCHHHYPNGSRCQVSIDSGSDLFCGRHLKNGRLSKTARALLAGMDGASDADLAAITAEMYGPVKSLDSAVAINHVFGNLFRLTLEGRIPQRRAAQLTTQLRSMLKSLEAAKAEITNARCFPGSNPALLPLLAALGLTSQTAAEHSSTQAEPQPARVAPGPCTAGFRQATDNDSSSITKSENVSADTDRAAQEPRPSLAAAAPNVSANPAPNTPGASPTPRPKRRRNPKPPAAQPNYTYNDALAASIRGNKDGLVPEDLNPGVPPDLRNQRHDGRPLSFNRRSVGPDGRGRGRWFGR